MATRGLMGALANFCEEIQTQKNAAAAKAGSIKVAGPTPSDPGGYLGASTHPTADADNGCQTATEGARSSENESDVKAQVGAPSVNSTADAKPGDDKDNSLNIGTKATLSGEHPEVEDDYKANKDDPGTSSPATVEDGKKYGSFHKAARAAIELGNSILADLAVGNDAAPAAPAVSPAAKTASQAASATFLAGYELAAGLGLDKVAAEGRVTGILADTVREAHMCADMVFGYVQKAAADEDAAESGEDHSTKGGEPEESGSGANAASSAGVGGGRGDAGGSGSGSGGTSDPSPAAGESSNPLAAVMGGAGGGMGAEPSLSQQPASEEEAIQALITALAELGIPIEELQAAGGGMGGAPGPAAGAPPAAGGMGGGPVPTDPMMGAGPKLAAAVKAYQRSGKYRTKTAFTAREREIIDAVKPHVLELVQS